MAAISIQRCSRNKNEHLTTAINNIGEFQKLGKIEQKTKNRKKKLHAI